MKTLCKPSAIAIALITLHLSPFTFRLRAAVPVRWTAETSRVQPQQLDAWRGDTLDLECTLKSYGQPVSLGAATASLMWQTNGMGSAWWQTNAMVSADGVIRATWSPSMDPGAAAVAFFMPVRTADGASYRAAGQIRFRPSPGAGAQLVPLPQPGGTIDFGDYQLVNAPWATLAAANEAIAAAVTSATGALVIPPPVDLGPYATTGYVAGAITSATGALVIPPPADLTPYATTGAVAEAVQTASSALAGQIQTVSNAAMPRAEMATYATQADVSTAIAGIQIPSLAGYATQSYVASYFATNYTPPDLSSYASRSYADAAASNAQSAAIAAIPSLADYATESYVADYFATNYTPPDLSSYASRSYADAAASNAQATAIAAIPSLTGYATEQWTADYFATNYTPPDLSSYASRSYADAVASNAQAAAIAAIPSLAGFATETYAQNAASDAASDALSAAQSYARDLSWAASQGNTRLVSIDGTIWQDATGTVWQVSYIYGWRGTALDLTTTTATPIVFDPVPGTNLVWAAGPGTNLLYDAAGMLSYAITISNVYYYAEGYPPQSATNLTFTTDFDQYYLYYLPVALATNPVDRILYASASGDAATADRAATIGTETHWTDATGCVWEVAYRYEDDWVADSSRITHVRWMSAGYDDDPVLWAIYFNVDGSLNDIAVYTSPPAPTLTNYTVSASEWITSYDGAFDFNIYRSPHTTTNLVGRVALTNDLITVETDPTVPDWAKEPSPPSYSAADVGAAPVSLVQAVTNLQVESALVYRLYSGSNVVAEVTNYNSQVHAPELRLMQLNESNEYITVWTETNGLSRTLRAATNYADRAIADHAAPRAWSKVTAGMGVEAPSNTTWLSTGRTVIAGGLEWEKHVTSGGAIWLLESNGMTADFNPQTNNVAFLDLSNADGTPIFRVEKTDSFLVGVHIENVTVDGDALVCHVPVVASEHPFVRVSTSLAEGSWHKEEDGIPSSLATVTWTGSVGDWTCRIENNTGGTPFFAQMEYLQEGGTKIVNSAPLDVSNGILCTDGIHKARPVYNNGTIIWEPVP